MREWMNLINNVVRTESGNINEARGCDKTRQPKDRVLTLESVTEAWEASHKSSWVREGNFDVFRNPSKSEVQAMFREHKDGLRALISNGDLIVWDAFAATHGDMALPYRDTVGASLILEPTRVVMNDIHFFYNEDQDTNEAGQITPYRFGLRRAWNEVVTNDWLKRYYGSFAPIGLDNGAEDDWQVFGVSDGAEKVLTSDWIAKNVASSA